jgi:hypothetical protein
MDVSRLRELGWEAKTVLHDGISEIVSTGVEKNWNA